MQKLLIILFITLGFFLGVALLGGIVFEKTYPYPKDPKLGVTFSPRYARYLKLDWKQTYISLLDGLKIRNFRLSTYWDILEKKEGEYDFSESDFLVNEAQKREARIILTVGIKQPRWPECHIPSWAEKLSVEDRRKKALGFIKQVVERYKSNSSIWAWQVENEPFLGIFGEGCDKPSEEFLKSEIELVKSLDSRPIIITDAGELGTWEIPMKLSDIFGISVYRKVYNPVLGYQNYPILPYMYNLKSLAIQKFVAKSTQKTIVTELQAEPWLGDKDSNANPQRQHELFSENNFKNNIEYAQKTGFDEFYLWGVEWWYFMEKNGYPGYLEHAKNLFN